MANRGESPILLTIKESSDHDEPRSVEFYAMGDGTVAITISTEGEPEGNGTIAIVTAAELGAVAKALQVLRIVPSE